MKLKLIPDPFTFRSKVPIPVAGGEDVEVEMVFRHKTLKALEEWYQSEKSDADKFLDVVEGWELEDAFTRENVELLLDNFGGSMLAMMITYAKELRGLRTKN